MCGIKHSGNYNIDLLKQELEISSGTDTELIVHPGLNNSQLTQRYGHWHFNWETEYNALMQPMFLQIIHQTGFRLTGKE